ADGGQTWGSAVQVNTEAPGNNEAFAHSVWYDQWTPGDTGTEIHIAWADLSAGTSNGNFKYRSLDTDGDTLGTQVTIETSLAGDVVASNITSIVKARGGNLYALMAWRFAGNEFARSVDGGANWVSRASPDWRGDSGAPHLTPGNESDNQDVYFVSIRSNQLQLHWYDDSGNSWTETEIDVGFGYSATEDGGTVATAIRHSDHHTLVTAQKKLNGTYDRRFYDISNGTTVTTMTNVYTGETLHGNASAKLLIDRHDRVYVAYSGIGGVSASRVGYKQSVDGGGTWGTEGRLDEDGVSVLVAGIGMVEAVDGGRVYGVWTIAGIEIWGSYVKSFLLQIWPGTVELDIDGYQPYFGGSGLDLRLRLRANSWRTEIKTGAKVLATAGYTGTAVTVSMVEFHIEVQGTVYEVHSVHPVTSGLDHWVDARDLEEAALLWNREGLRRKAKLTLAL
ncbi:hypothetical protein LCGC14_2658280, partial [marine sediment metagenome]